MVEERSNNEERYIVWRCTRAIRAYMDGAINQDELFYNLTVILIHAAIIDAESGSHLADGSRPSLALLPANLVREWDEWTKREVATADYMPSPNAFMADTRDAVEVEAKKRELRPFYIALHDLLRH